MELPIILLLTVVAPVWIVFHYITIWKKNPNISADDEHTLGEIRAKADKLGDRIETLERILDSEVPDWRQRKNDTL